MSQSLIGYLLKGPQHISVSEEALQYLSKVKILHARTDYEQSKLQEWDLYSSPFSEGLNKDLKEFLGIDPNDYQEVQDFLTAGSEMPTPQKFAKDFEDFWNGEDCRMACFRTDPDDRNQKFCFIGDSSYGDSPDFDEYRTLDAAFRFKLLDKVGIK